VEGGLAVSADGNLAGFVQPDGTPVIVQDDGQVSVELPRIDRGSGFDAVAVTGTDCQGTSESGCALWVNSKGRDPELWVTTLGGSAENPRPEMMSLADVLGGQLVAGMTSATDDGSCSAVGPLDGDALWSTCAYQLGAFSPDGKLLSALPAYVDGAGTSEVAVLGAKTGQAVLDLHTAPDAYIGQMVWEDESHLLLGVGEGTRAGIVRLGLDGSREYAVPPVTTEPFETPFVLPSR
jgi:hypothetical protein